MASASGCTACRFGNSNSSTRPSSAAAYTGACSDPCSLANSVTTKLNKIICVSEALQAAAGSKLTEATASDDCTCTATIPTAAAVGQHQATALWHASVLPAGTSACARIAVNFRARHPRCWGRRLGPVDCCASVFIVLAVRGRDQ